MPIFPRFSFGGQKRPEPQTDMLAMSGPAHGASVTINNSKELDDFLKQHGDGGRMNYERAMRMSAVLNCIRLISGGVANTPMMVHKIISDIERQPARGTETWNLLKKRPNHFMRPAQLVRMSIMHVMLRGNFYAIKAKAVNRHTTALVPIMPDLVTPKQSATGEITYVYNRPNGNPITFQRDEILHLWLYSMDGVKGMTPIDYAKSTIEGALAQEGASNTIFKNGLRAGGLLSTEKELGKTGRANIREALEEHKAGGDNEGKDLILEEGMKYYPLSVTAQDAQWLDAKKMSKADVYEIFGVPLHMTALADKQSNWGSGVEQHNKQFMQWVLEDYYVMWEEAANCDLLGASSDLEVSFMRDTLLRGDIKAQTERDKTDLIYQVRTPDEVRNSRGMNPRADGKGGEVLPLPNAKIEPESDDNSTADKPESEE